MDPQWNPRTARQVRRELENWYDKSVSQVELANWLGYSRSAIQNWEAGRAVPEPAMRFLYDKLLSEPGYMAEIRQWSGTNANGKHQAS